MDVLSMYIGYVYNNDAITYYVYIRLAARLILIYQLINLFQITEKLQDALRQFDNC